MPQKNRQQNRSPRNLLPIIAGLFVSLLVLAPLIPMGIWSVSTKWFFPDLVPPEFSSRAWEYVFSPASQSLQALLKGTVIALVATLISLIIGVPAGRALGLYQFRGKRFVQFLLLAPVIVPVLAVVMGMHIVFIKYGLAGTMHGVIIAHLIPMTPYVIIVMTSVFANYDVEFEEQARTLGADPFRTFLFVTFPAVYPGILVATLFAFILSWGQYVLTLMIGAGRVVTLPLQLFSFATSGDNSITAAVGILYLAPTILILILTAKYLTGENAAMGGFGA